MFNKEEDLKKKKRNMIIFGGVGLAIIIGLSVILNYTRQKTAPPPPSPKIELTKKEEETARDAWVERSSQALLEQQKRIEELEKMVQGTSKKEQPLNVPMPQPPIPFPEGKPEQQTQAPLPQTETMASGKALPQQQAYASPKQSGPGAKNAPAKTATEQVAPDFPPPPVEQSYPQAEQGKEPVLQTKEPKESKVLTNLIVMDIKEKAESKDKQTEKADKKKSSKEEKGQEKEKAYKLTDYLPDGSYVKAVLLNGVEAPTGQHGVQDPYPVLLRVVDLASLPNRFKSDFVDCRMVGEARGSLSSNRVLMKVVTLSCLKSDGTVMVEPVTGYVNGEDGKVGVSGIVVTKQGAILARMLLADFINGIGGALRQTATTITVGTSGTVQTVNPQDALTASIGSGLAQTASRLAQFYYDMAKEMFPVIEVNAGRTVEVVFISSTAKGR